MAEQNMLHAEGTGTSSLSTQFEEDRETFIFEMLRKEKQRIAEHWEDLHRHLVSEIGAENVELFLEKEWVLSGGPSVKRIDIRCLPAHKANLLIEAGILGFFSLQREYKSPDLSTWISAGAKGVFDCIVSPISFAYGSLSEVPIGIIQELRRFGMFFPKLEREINKI